MQNRAILFLAEILNAVCVMDNDVCHTLWNIFRRSITKVKAIRLEMSFLKATIA